MSQPIAEWDTSRLARFVEDMIRQNAPSALVNIGVEELTVTEKLSIADEMEASQQAIDYMRPPPQILLSNAAHDAVLPSGFNVTVSRYVKNAVLFVSTTHYGSGVGATAIGVEWDGVSLGTLNFNVNQAIFRLTMNPVAFTLSEVAVGTHNINFTNAGNANCNTDDRCTVILYGG